MIDIGIGRFLEMFEERFGRTATTGLLGIIGLGITAFMLSIIWQDLFVPVYKFSIELVSVGISSVHFEKQGWALILSFVINGSVMFLYVVMIYGIAGLLSHWDRRHSNSKR